MEKLEWGKPFCKIYLCNTASETGKPQLTCQPVMRKGLTQDSGPLGEFVKKMTKAFCEVFDALSEEERAALKAELLQVYVEWE